MQNQETEPIWKPHRQTLLAGRFVGVFAPLRDAAEFRKVRVDGESGSVAWPNGADLDPLVLYAKIKGVEIEKLLTTKSPIQG